MDQQRVMVTERKRSAGEFVAAVFRVIQNLLQLNLLKIDEIIKKDKLLIMCSLSFFVSLFFQRIADLIQC